MKKYFLTGLVTLLPVAVTLWVVAFFVNFLTKPFLGVTTYLLRLMPFAPIHSPQVAHTISQLLTLIALFLLTLAIGLAARRYFFHGLLRLGDRMLFKIPLVNKIYKTSKDIVQSLFASNGQSFKQVVLVTFPGKGCYCLGLIAADAPKTCSDAAKETLVSVFLPTTPNPTTGYLIVAPEKELIFLSMRTEEAIKYIVSCAVIQPESFERKR